MAKKAILVLDYTYAGGVERVTSLLSYIFKKESIGLDYIISLKAEFEQPYMNYPEGLPILVVKPGNDKPVLKGSLRDLLIKHEIKLLIFQGDNVGISFDILREAKAANCKAFLHYHGSPFGYIKKYIYSSDLRKKPTLVFKLLWSYIVYPIKLLRVVKLVKKTNAGFICVSKGVQNEILSLWPWNKDEREKIDHVPNPLTFSSAKNILGEKENIVVYVGRLERRHKNAMLVLEAWNKIAEEYSDWKLLLLGHGRIEQPMRNYVKHHNLINVEFAGVVQDVASVLAKTAISVLSSDCEGMPMSMLESAAHYNALISTNSDGGITDIIVHEETGILVPKNNAVALADGISKLIDNKIRREQLALAAQKRINLFSDKSIAEKWKGILKNIE